MHLFSYLAEYWWAVLLVMLAIMATFILVAGHGAAGGLAGRTSSGWRKWQALSHKAGEIQARVILTLFYFTVVVPFGLARTHLSDPLRLRRSNQSRAWLPRQTRDLTLDDARRQF